MSLSESFFHLCGCFWFLGASAEPSARSAANYRVGLFLLFHRRSSTTFNYTCGKVWNDNYWPAWSCWQAEFQPVYLPVQVIVSAGSLLLRKRFSLFFKCKITFKEKSEKFYAEKLIFISVDFISVSTNKNCRVDTIHLYVRFMQSLLL